MLCDYSDDLVMQYGAIGFIINPTNLVKYYQIICHIEEIKMGSMAKFNAQHRTQKQIEEYNRRRKLHKIILNSTLVTATATTIKSQSQNITSHKTTSDETTSHETTSYETHTSPKIEQIYILDHETSHETSHTSDETSHEISHTSHTSDETSHEKSDETSHEKSDEISHTSHTSHTSDETSHTSHTSDEIYSELHPKSIEICEDSEEIPEKLIESHEICENYITSSDENEIVDDTEYQHVNSNTSTSNKPEESSSFIWNLVTLNWWK
jgi:hypothetical protein